MNFINCDYFILTIIFYTFYKYILFSNNIIKKKYN